MRFADHLIAKANEIRSIFLNSNDKDDGTEIDEDWRNTKVFYDNKNLSY